ncbi:MAG TPA: DUF3109 family protein [Candidatus Polarisedimenticolia bacterium]|nr:DUF3109 family protein [Candidatus Polarisedimenticolia bacterium]
MKADLAKIFSVVRDHLGLNVQAIGPRVLRKIFTGGASVRNCDGSCCRGGTTVSIEERDRILGNAGAVSEAMTSGVRGEPSRWFDRRLTKDRDFTAGFVTNTRVHSGACVFYRNDGLCALQVAGKNELHGSYALKPAICVLWPLCVEDRTLDVGYAWFTRRRACCAPVRRGRRTILEVIAPDQTLITEISRRGASRGGGAPSRS